MAASLRYATLRHTSPPSPPLSPRHGYTGCDKSPQNPGRLHAPSVARRVWTARGASHDAAWCFSHVGRIQAGGGYYVRGCRRRRPPCLGRNHMPLSRSLGRSLLLLALLLPPSLQAREGDGEQFAKRVRLSIELPAYREERRWPARHMQTEGPAAVLSRAAGVCRLVWMVDVTRGPWLKIGDAPPPGPRPSLASPNVPVCARQCPPLCTSRGRKGRLKLSVHHGRVAGVNGARHRRVSRHGDGDGGEGVSTLSLAERGGDAATNYPSVQVSCMAVRPHREVVRWWGARSSRPSTGLILL